MKIRHRIQTRLFRKPVLVLQIGTVKNTGCNDETTPPSGQNKDYISWVDAKVCQYFNNEADDSGLK